IPSTVASLTLTAEASVENGALEGVEFFDGEQSLGTVTAAPYQFELTELKAGQHIFRAKAKATDGRNASSPLIRAAVVGPFQAGVNLNGNSLNADGVPLQSQSDALSAGLTITNTQPVSTSGSLTLYPSPDAPTGILLSNQLLRLSATGNSELGITYPIPNGYYDVFLFIVEDQTSYSRSMRLLVEGQLLARGIGDQAKGEWHKYGPYRTKVVDGTLNLGLQQDTKGVPKVAAFSVYQAAAPPASSDIRLGIEQAGGLSVLSYPAGLTNPKIEASDDLLSAWQDLVAPVSYFSDQEVVPVPVDRPKRFFRLRSE
ncbi:MAG: Ig-like domain-containing protein, partial [Luteolibacter sp.]